MGRPTIAEVDLSAIAHNFHQIRKLVGPDVKICPAVKADAYGHGAIPVSRTILAEGADMLGVATIEEAIELRDAGIHAPILILGCLFEDQIADVIEYGITPMVSSRSFAEELSRRALASGKRIKVHVKVDTGMGRVGIQSEDAVDFVLVISQLPGLEIEGIFTHFPSSDEEDLSFTRRQVADLEEIIRDIESAGVRIPIRHAASSAAILGIPDAYFNMVRPGIILYGLCDSAVPSNVELRQAMTLKTKIAYLKELPPGRTVSYGRTFTASRPTLVATLPIGYADGYNRLLSNRGPALVRGQRVHVIGRVCMDQMMLDVTGVPGVSVGDEVVLYGSQGSETISIREIAGLLGTITYEVTCAVSRRVPRAWERTCPHVHPEARGDTCAPGTGADGDIGGPRYGWHTRGYLPHFDSDAVIQMVTYRLADSLPRHVAERLAEETDTIKGNAAYRRRMERYLDAGYGECLLRDSRIARMVEESLLYFDGKRYEIQAWVIMPNHVHVLVRVYAPYLLSDVVKGWKSFTARKINEYLGRKGTVWQKEYWDRYVRNERHWGQAVAYIHENPVKAGLIPSAEDWCFGSARDRTCPHVPSE
jgi:alanine racemase